MVAKWRASFCAQIDMNLKISRRKNERGSTLVVALGIALVTAGSLIVHLRLTMNQNQLITRSQVWNGCMPMLEAGIEDALNHCSRNNTNMVSNGWTLSGGRYRATNSLGEGYYEVSISTNTPYDVISTGFLPMPGSSTHVSRSVRVTTSADPIISGLVARSDVGMNGNNVLIDSYDSRDPAKSTNGQYDPAKAGDKADVVCLKAGGNTFDIGNGNIWGHAIVPPGGVVSTGPNGAVGSVAWHRGGNKKIQPGWVRTDVNRTLAPVTLPFATGVAPHSGTVEGKAYNHIFDGGNFQMADLDKKVIVTASSSVYVTSDIQCSHLVIKSNATFKIYCAASSAHFTQVDNENGSGPTLMLYGLPTLTSIHLGNKWGGGVYAPNANFSVAGNADLCGALVANSISLKGNSAFHYDEAFNQTNQVRAWVISTWQEQ
jgi:hypothetical protein